ncbi:MAG: hypothetical protein V2A56_12875 [bacterium]
MEHQLEAWLKTYRGEAAISPATWAELPKDCKRKLDNYARDEAVRRADEFARDGHLDLDRQDAIRQLVDSMAQCWMLPGEEARRIVEDFLDELPANPGFEFDKLSTRTFRRRVNGTWKDLLDSFDLKKEPKIISIVSRELDVDRRKNTDRTSFLAAWREAYDHWSLAEAKDAVNELIDLVNAGATGATEVSLREILPLIKHRGGASWAKALELELEVGVEAAVREDLIRMLKRYALIVRREGALAEPPKPRTISVDLGIEGESVAAQHATLRTEPEVEPLVSVETEPEPEEPKTPDVEEESESSEEDAEVEALEPAESIFNQPSEEDREAAEELFGNAESEVQAVEEIHHAVDVVDEDSEQVVEEKESAVSPVEAQEVVSPPSKAAIRVPEKETPDEHEGARKKRLKDVFSPSPVRDKKDRFAVIRSGEFRERVVREMYSGDATLLDVFLAKLSGAPDWNRAKQFIANEFFRCKVDLHSELGEELFLKLKENLSE